MGGAQAGEASSSWFFDNLVVGNWHLELNDASVFVAEASCFREPDRRLEAAATVCEDRQNRLVP